MEVPQFTEEAAAKLLAVVRWPEDGDPLCPQCGAGNPYEFKTRPRFYNPTWKCRECGRQFTLLSGTPFQSNKLPVSKLVRAMWAYDESGGKISGMALMRLIGVQYKIAYILKRKLWESAIDPDGRLAHRSLLGVGYFQGFNLFSLDESGNVVVRNSKGKTRLRWAA